MSDLSVTLESIHVHPVKSCTGTSLRQAVIAETGLDLDREWVVVDPAGRFVSQRELPRLALVATTLKSDELILRAPGMLALHVAIDRVEAAIEVEVWRDRVAAFDMGALCAQWFTDFLGRPLRLARFDPDSPRRADRQWTGADRRAAGVPGWLPAARRLDRVARRGQPPPRRDRRGAGDDGALPSQSRPRRNRLARRGPDRRDRLRRRRGHCPAEARQAVHALPIPDVDPATGIAGHAVGDVLAQYRADPRLGGAITFAMNAVVVEGVGCTLAQGMQGSATYAFA